MSSLSLARSVEVVGPEPTLPELASVANREHALVRDSAVSMVEHAIAAGQALADAKAKLEHGEWLAWLGGNFEGSRQTADVYRTVAANCQRAGNLNLDGLSLRAVLKRIERINREEEAAKLRELPIAAVEEFGAVEIRHGDLRSSLDDLVGQVDAIVTDPPYPVAFLDEFSALSEVASRLLKPGGVLAAMVGQAHLPAYLERLSEHLSYRWTAAYLTDGPATRVHAPKVGTKWKPILLFDLDDKRRFLTQDVYISDADDKEHHDWGQSESGFARLIEGLTRPQDLVVDPFLGGGTAAIVCRDLGRRFVGCDVDKVAVVRTRQRLAA